MLFFGDAAQPWLPGPIHLLVVLALAVWLTRPRSTLRRGALLLFAWAWIFSTPALASLALAALEGDVDATVRIAHERADATADEPLWIVMGAGAPAAGDDGEAQPNLAGWLRVDTGARAWHRHGGHLLMAGGLGLPADPVGTSLATRMRSKAIALGVDPARVTAVGHAGGNSLTDLAAAAPVALAHRGPVFLVTSAAHMPRSLGTARALGFEPQPLPCDSRTLRSPSWRAWLPSHGGPALWELALHEWLGMLYYRLRGWL